MKLLFMDKNKTYLPLLLVVLMVIATFSCISENDDDCGITVRFAYNHNILSADALRNQVDEVTLYIFDNNGILAQQYTNAASSPIIRLADLKSGHYHFVAWAQSNHITSDQSYFSIPKLKAGVSSIDELTYRMKREASGFQRHELNNFLVGMSKVMIGDDDSHFTVELKKVTNKIRVVLLPYAPGGKLDVADYEFSIIDKVGNGHINYDYTLLPDKKIKYLPYYAANLEPNDTGALLPGEIDRAAVVEINTSRLLEANAPHLCIIEKEGGRKIVSMNLPWAISLIGIENSHKWSLQEYLDRQDNYTIILYFNDSNWMNFNIIINGWAINAKEIEL